MQSYQVCELAVRPIPRSLGVYRLSVRSKGLLEAPHWRSSIRQGELIMAETRRLGLDFRNVSYGLA